MSEQQSLQSALSAFTRNLTLDDIPAEALDRAKDHMLDTLGVALASARFGFAQSAVDAFASTAGTATVIGFDKRVASRDAATVNGVLIHGLDYDDASVYGRVHPSSFCLPAALAVSEERGLSGSELLLGYIIGLESSIRLGAVARGGFQRRGFHPTGVVGSFGASLIAGRLMGLAADQLNMAQGIALSLSGGSQEFVTDGAWTKRLHPGFAAAGGITSAMFAANGFSGPKASYDGRFGLFPLYLREEFDPADLSMVADGLGERWDFLTLGAKPLPACYFNVPVIDAVIRIARENDLVPGEVERMEILVPTPAIQQVCEPKPQKRRPAECYAAVFSVYFCAAAAFTRRRFTLAELDQAVIEDGNLHSLMDRIDYRLDEQTTFPKFYSAAVNVWTKDGRYFEAREDIHRGAQERPLSKAELIGKFEDNARSILPETRLQPIRELIANLVELADVRALTRLLRPSG